MVQGGGAGGLEKKAQSWTFVTTSTHKFSPNCLPCVSAAIGCVVFLFVVRCCCCGGVIVIVVVADVIQVDVVGNVQNTVVIL